MKAWLIAILVTAVLAGEAWAGADLPDAAAAGDAAAVTALLRQKTDVDAAQPDGTTALIWAAHRGDEAMVAQLLKAGADAGLANMYGASAMGEAATIGHAGIIKLLLKAGVDPGAANVEGQTPLMAVARTGHVDAARVLIEAGADVNAIETWGGQSALMWAAAQSQADMVAYLVRHGADVNAKGAARIWQRRITAEPRPKDLNKGGFTALLYAARQGCIDCARHLVEGGADLNATDPDRVSPLILALLNFNFDLAHYLIEAGADVNQWDLYGRTPLYTAIDMNTIPIGGRTDIPTEDQRSGIDIARELLERGANPDIQLKLRPPYRNTAFDRGDNNSLITGATPLLRAAKASDDEAVKLLLAHGAQVDLANVMGVTPFMSAAGVDQSNNPTRGRFKTDEDAVETVKILVAAGADIHRHAGVYRDYLEPFTDPLSKFKRTAYDGQTALHGAAKKGWNRTVAYLVGLGLDLEARDALGRTPLDLAYGRYEPAFLDAQPAPLPDTIALLMDLCHKQPTCHLSREAGL